MSSAAPAAQLRRLGFFGRLDLEIDDLAAGLGGRGQHVQFGLERPREAPAKGLAPAGGDGRYVAMGGKELLHQGQRRGWLGQPIQPEFEEPGVGQSRLSSFGQPGRRIGLNGDAQLVNPQPKAGQWRGRRGSGNCRAGG
jgi:hypothetical protein